jgi:GDP-L-fucose synthase
LKVTDKILILGSRGMVGSSLVRFLHKRGFSNLLSPARNELNLLDQVQVQKYFQNEKPQHVFLAAAKVGGIKANNNFRADFILENLQIQSHVFEAAFKYNVERLMFLGSSCIYPKNCPQPIKEEYLLTSTLEETNEPYAIAKIAGLKLAENFRRQYGKKFYSIMPCNLYGENDNYHPENSHVIPGLIRRMHEAQKNGDSVFEIWGDGTPLREFLYVDDLAEACVLVMQKAHEKTPYWLNVGSSEEVSIGNLAKMIAKELRYEGKLAFNSSVPNGTPRKVLDSSKLHALGWKPRTFLEQGLKNVIRMYRETYVQKS